MRNSLGLAVALLLSVRAAHAVTPPKLSALTVVGGTAFYTYDHDGGACPASNDQCSYSNTVHLLSRGPVDGSQPNTQPSVADWYGLAPWNNGRALMLTGGTDEIAGAPHLAFTATGPGVLVPNALAVAQMQNLLSPGIVRLPTGVLYISDGHEHGYAGLLVNKLDYEGNVLSTPAPILLTDDVDLIGLVPSGDGAVVVWADRVLYNDEGLRPTSVYAMHVNNDGALVETTPVRLEPSSGDYFTLAMIGGTSAGFGLHKVVVAPDTFDRTDTLQFYDANLAPGALITMPPDELTPRYWTARTNGFCEAWIGYDAYLETQVKAQVRDAAGTVISGDALLVLDPNVQATDNQGVWMASEGDACYAAYSNGDGTFSLATFNEAGVVQAAQLTAPGPSPKAGCAVAGNASPPPMFESLLCLLLLIGARALMARRVIEARR